ncbi:MAG: ATP-binding protein [Planctomycetota bacterium]|nr:ATP-binding protein [Planctomycetota bacterium]
MRVAAAEKQLDLQTELAGPLPATVLTDPLRLRQVLINLVGNAIKFTDHGTIRLTVRLTSDGGPPRLRFDVTDTGLGMNTEQVGQLFQPFMQVDSSATRKFGGTGLGLCICKHLAKSLGGDLEVRSQPGQGSTFSVTIDPGPLDGIRLLSEGVAAALEVASSRIHQNSGRFAVQPLPRLDPKSGDFGYFSSQCATSKPAAAGLVVLHGHILLAEDSLDSQRLLALLLKRAGAEVTVVENGQLAVAAAWAAHEAGRPFNVILMDMSMPVLDGFEATRQLRKRGYTAPIIALTAYAMTEDLQKCLAAGCNDYATKPIDRQRLLATVAPWVARGQTPDAAPAATHAPT